MNDCIDRIQSQEDQRSFRVANNAQGGEHTQEYLDGLTKSVGNVFVIDKAEIAMMEQRDEEGFNDLRNMIG